MNEDHPMNRAAVKASHDPMVFVVDDDAALRDALSSLLRSVGLRVETFASVADFALFQRPDVPSCLILDVRLKDTNGLEFQSELARSRVDLPIVFMTGHGDIAMTVRAMKAGAVDFLAKPFREQDLLDAVTVALDRDKACRKANKATHEIRSRFQTLTPREKEIMGLAASGLMNKQIAGEVGLSEITVKIHRGHAMKKMHAKSFAELVRMAEMLESGK
jgi:FixJ family two-component response regulator